MINRYELISRHNPKMAEVDFQSPLTIGNGELAYTVDITGMQTLSSEYSTAGFPLCTMTQWGWHSIPVNGNAPYYKLDDISWTYYNFNNRKVKYASIPQEGNGEVYNWLRENPHRLNLGNIGLEWKGQRLIPGYLSSYSQELKLWEGIIESRFSISGKKCLVKTACHYEEDIIGFIIKSNSLINGDLSIVLNFPYGSSGISGSDWNKPTLHKTTIIDSSKTGLFISRILDNDGYGVEIRSDQSIEFKESSSHNIIIRTSSPELVLGVRFISNNYGHNRIDNCCCTEFNPSDIFTSSRAGWKKFWEEGGAVDFKRSINSRSHELERRVILSQYLIAIQSSGSMPPQETGLTCNSWYGKFHLEMHLWHAAYLPMWNRSKDLKKSLLWYKDNIGNARENASRNGYKGVRWPKMVAYGAIDSPSTIATLLIWQQPHILYLLELVYNNQKDNKFLNEYYELVSETANFMCDFPVYNSEKDCYDLKAPIIPAQETFNPEDVLNPTFEVAYWKFGLEIAIKWGQRIGADTSKWTEVSRKMAKLPMAEGLYLSHELCPDTFTKYNMDHPSMVGAFGLINYPNIDKGAMEKTLLKVCECWDFNSMWGWDFAMMAMTAVRVGRNDLAIDILLKDSPKNEYMVNGNNYQKLRKDLPIYLPGNGSILIALTMMVAGYGDSTEVLPGFPKDGTWDIEYENITKFPY